jgi:hypothetical protein
VVIKASQENVLAIQHLREIMQVLLAARWYWEEVMQESFEIM